MPSYASSACSFAAKPRRFRRNAFDATSSAGSLAVAEVRGESLVTVTLRRLAQPSVAWYYRCRNQRLRSAMSVGLNLDRRRWSALALIVTAQFMVILDIAIVNV